jgi:hypothetical protein
MACQLYARLLVLVLHTGLQLTTASVQMHGQTQKQDPPVQVGTPAHMEMLYG